MASRGRSLIGLYVLCAAAVMHAAAQPLDVVAYTHAPDNGPPIPAQDVFSIRLDGSGMRPLTSDGHSHNPTWSPDSKRILFIHDAALSTRPPYRETEEWKSHHSIELSVMDADGSNRHVLRVIEPVIFSAAWSPDGNTLAISAKTYEALSTTLYLLPANGGGELRSIAANAWTPSWSADGKRLAFTVERPRGHWTIHTANADGSNDVRLTDDAKDSGSPAWSPDNKRIAFDQFTDRATRQQIFVMDADGSHVRQLTTDTAWSCEHPAWTRGGDALVVACRSAASPCGMVSSTGQTLPECTRRLFLISLGSGTDAKPTLITDHDGAQPALAGRLKPSAATNAYPR